MSCKKAVFLISQSRNMSQFNWIEACANNPYRKLSAFKYLLHPPTSSPIYVPGKETAMAHALSAFLVEKVLKNQDCYCEQTGWRFYGTNPY